MLHFLPAGQLLNQTLLLLVLSIMFWCRGPISQICRDVFLLVYGSFFVLFRELRTKYPRVREREREREREWESRDEMLTWSFLMAQKRPVSFGGVVETTERRFPHFCSGRTD